MAELDLSSIMEFDHVIVVTEAGDVIDAPAGIHAPTLMDEALDDRLWELITYGYTGQHGYRGPVMHNSETIRGGLATHILTNPGTYVAVVADWTCADHDECDCDLTEGWAIARLIECPHVWVAGMCYVHPEDVETVAATRKIECENCDATRGPGGSR